MATASIFTNVPAGASAFHETMSWFHSIFAGMIGESKTSSPFSFVEEENFENLSIPTKWLKSLLAGPEPVAQPEKNRAVQSRSRGVSNFIGLTGYKKDLFNHSL